MPVRVLWSSIINLFIPIVEKEDRGQVNSVAERKRNNELAGRRVLRAPHELQTANQRPSQIHGQLALGVRPKFGDRRPF